MHKISAFFLALSLCFLASICAASAQTETPDEVTFPNADGSCVAVFKRASLYELAEIRVTGRPALKITTTSDPLPDPPQKEKPVGEITKFSSSADEFHVEFERGAFRFESTYAWEGNALALRRGITCLRKQKLKLSWPFLRVSFDGKSEQLVSELGLNSFETPLPAKSWIPFWGNWLATSDSGGNGLAIVYPRQLRFSYTLSALGPRGGFQINDLGYWGRHTIKPGMHSEHKLWIVPLEAGSRVGQGEAITRTICERLKKSGDLALDLFRYSFASPGRRGHTLGKKSSLTLWQADAADTVQEKIAPPIAKADGISLAMARGETEPIHLVLSPDAAMKNLRVECSPLTNGDSTIAAKQFRVRYSAYARIRPTTKEERANAANPKTLRFAAVIDDGKEFLESDTFYGSSARSVGPVEDVLFDRDSIDLKVGSNQPVWITLAVPRDTHPGLYSGKIRVLTGDEEILTVPIKVKVWSFTLPRVSSMDSWYQLFAHFLFSDDYPGISNNWKEYYRNLAEHKIAGFGHIPMRPKLKLVDGKVVVDWKEFDEFCTYVFDDLGMRNAKLPWGKRGGGRKPYDFIGLKENTPEFEAALADYMTQARIHLKERGWLEGIDCYLWDEPQPEAIPAVRRVAPIIQKTIPEINTFVAGGVNSDGLEDIIKAWCPGLNEWKLPAGSFNAERIAKGRSKGDVLWWYNLDYDAVGDSIVAHRAMPWATWNQKVDGYFIWAINTWGLPTAPWVQGNPIGSGFFIYPGKDGPVDSIRWEMTREGLEDYDYIVLLDKALKRKGLPPELRARGNAVLARIKKQAGISNSECLIAADPRDLMELRQEMGELLHRLSRRK